jgi:hypothetical protein
MFDSLLSSIGSFFSSEGVGQVLSAAAPAAIAAYAGGQQAGANEGLEREKLQIQLGEAQKERDLRLLLAQLQGGGGGSGAANLSARGGILNNVVEQILQQNKIKSDAIDKGAQNAMAPLMQRFANPRIA